MGRSLISTSTRQGSLSARLNNKLALALSGIFTVPAGVKQLYYTGVAAGGRDASTPLSPFSNFATTLAIGMSASENICFISTTYAGATSAPRIDPVGQKVSQMGSSTAINGNTGGFESLAADNGVMLTRYNSVSFGRYSIDGGRLWVNTSTNIVSGNNMVALMPVTKDTSTIENRVAYVASATSLTVWTGTTFTESSSYVGKSFKSMSYANNYFIAGENNATTFTSIYYKLAADATNANGWATVVLNGANDSSVNDVSYGGGLYVAACGSGKLYTASTIGGTWTSRTSNTTSSIEGIKYANSRWVGVCANGTTITSTDGITWTNSAVVGEGAIRYRKDLVYLPSTAQWCATQNVGGATVHYSTNGNTWTAYANNATLIPNTCAASYAGLIVASPSAVYVIPDPSKSTYYTLSTNGDGGQARLLRTSNNTEILRLSGGFNGLTGNYIGWGGSSTDIEMRGLGMGQGGVGADKAGSTGTGTAQLGGVPGGGTIGGGAALMLQDLIGNDGMTGIKIPGGAGRTGGASTGGGGGSLMAYPGVSTGSVGTGNGPGGGGAKVAGEAGGGGEGIIRFMFTVLPNEVIAFSNGLAQRSEVGGEPQLGAGFFEWES